MHGFVLVVFTVSLATTHAWLALTPKLAEEQRTRLGSVAGSDDNGNAMTYFNDTSLPDYVLPVPIGPNHGTPSDPKRVLCGPSLIGKLCQICPDHIVCLGGAWENVPPRVLGGCCNRPGCTDRFIASEACATG